MAKGVEDTATYRYDGLLSHAEVGCDPDRASCGVDEFIDSSACGHRAREPAGSTARRPTTPSGTRTPAAAWPSCRRQALRGDGSSVAGIAASA